MVFSGIQPDPLPDPGRRFGKRHFSAQEVAAEFLALTSCECQQQSKGQRLQWL